MKKLIQPMMVWVFLLFGTTLSAQEILEGIQADRLFTGTSCVRTSQFSDAPSYLKFRDGMGPNRDGALNWITKNFAIQPAFGFEYLRTDYDELGFEHVRYVQTYQGSKVEDAIWILHIKNDQVISMNGLLYTNFSAPGSYSISEENALSYALDFVDAETYKWEVEEEEAHLKREQNNPFATYYPSAEKVYISADSKYLNNTYRAAYKFNIYAHSKLYRAFIYVDAQTGEILLEEEIIHHVNTPGTAITAYSGSQNIVSDSFSGSYRLRETTRGNGVNTYDMNTGTSYGAAVDFTDTDNIWNNVNADLDQYATDAHWGAEMTYDYFFYQHGRNSIDNAGFALNSYVHYDVNYDNAFWDGSRMTYGDGDGSTDDPLTSIDIAGHEIAHGLTTYTADLNYSAESGALNESFSDIFGTSIENYARPSNWNWTMGEDIGGAFRSMSNPNAYGDPDTYFGTNWASLTGGDNGGVHTNSGVQNYWYYLMVMGGSGTNDQAEAYSVTGLGFTQASQITFRNLTVYLTPTSEFADARFYAIQSAIDLFGACTPQVETTTNAWYAVGVGNAYVATVVADFAAPVTSSCSAPFTVNFSNNSVNGTSFVWDFGDGGNSTANNPSHTYTAVGTYTVTLTADGGACGTDNLVMTNYITIDNMLPCEVIMPTSGSGNLQTACAGTVYDSGGPSSVYGANQDAQITISPSGASTVTLTVNSFDVEAGSSGTNCNYDYLRVYDGPSTGSTLLGTYCNNNLPPATINSSGGSITLVFHSDGGLEENGFDIDWNCTLATTPPVADFIADVTSSCSGEINFSDLSTNGPTSWSWNFGDGNFSTSQNPSHAYSTNGTFTVQLTATNSYGSDPEIKTSYITINKPAAPSATGDAICENTTADLSASGTGTLNWYDAPSGGTLITSGTSYTTPPLSSTTTYYVEEEIAGDINFVGPATNAFGTGGNFNGDQHQVFTCTTPVILKSVKVYANGAGDRTIQLRDNTGTVIQELVVNIPNGTSNVTLNFDIPVGTNLQLGTLAGSSPSLYRNNAGASYPYTLPGYISITSSSAGGAYYYFFYNWEIEEYPCTSLRAPVTATVTPNADATITNPGALCTTDAPITLNGADAGGTWSGTGVSGSTFDPAAAGIGSHTITYTIAGACGDTDTETIVVSDGYDATINPVSALCSQDPSFNLSGADAGGVWSGTGITNSASGTFDPATAGVGTHTITYTFSGTCGDTDTETITVNQQTDASILTNPELCSNSSSINLTAAENGGTWSGTGITDVVNGTFDPSVSGVGTFTITYSIGGLCPDTDTEDITVSDLADATIDPVSDFCSADAPVNLTAADNGGTWSGTGITNTSNGTFDPLVAGTGTFTITYTIAGACGDTDTENITVNQQSDATITALAPLCRQQGNVILTAAENGGTWSADCGACINASTGEFNPSLAGIGNWSVTYTVGTICPDTKTTIISVLDCLGMNENSDNQFTMYPNPAQQTVTIQTNNNDAAQIIITDATGRIVLSQYTINTTTTLAVDHLADGIYYVRLINADHDLIGVGVLVRE
ncbi:MAG: M4 family metallopeptidase [Crocinitomicaceae bacterium]|nr:M4 family metallopeptidase [Crocinitomicaceae bacterium]